MNGMPSLQEENGKREKKARKEYPTWVHIF